MVRALSEVKLARKTTVLQRQVSRRAPRCSSVCPRHEFGIRHCEPPHCVPAGLPPAFWCTGIQQDTAAAVSRSAGWQALEAVLALLQSIAAKDVSNRCGGGALPGGATRARVLALSERRQPCSHPSLRSSWSLAAPALLHRFIHNLRASRISHCARRWQLRGLRAPQRASAEQTGDGGQQRGGRRRARFRSSRYERVSNLRNCAYRAYWQCDQMLTHNLEEP